MKRTKQRLGIYTVLLFLVTAATVALKTVALLYDFDFETGYFKDKLLSNISDWVLLGGVLLSLSFVAVGRPAALRSSFSSPTFYLPSGLVGVGLLFLSGEHFKAAFTIVSDRLYLGFGIFSAELILELLVAILALLSIGYFILGSLVEGRRDTSRAAFGIAMALFLSLYAAYLYFDMTLPLNAPTKVLDEMAYIFTSAFFLFEIRISLGRDRWGAYLAFGMTAALLTASASLPALILYFTRGAIISNSLADSVLAAALFIFTSTRVLHALALRADKKSPLAEIAEARSKENLSAPAESVADVETDDGEPDNYTMTFDEGEAE